MKIALMLRAFGEKGGVGVYTRNVTRELIERDAGNEYLLLYSDPEHLGTHSGSDHVRELVLEAPNKLLWDQVAVPKACRREGVDVLFHPKFSVPLFAGCKTSMVLHGAGWFIPEVKHFWSLPQRIYARLTMPIYCRRADAVMAVSDITTRVFTEKFGLPEGKVQTVYLAPASFFGPVVDPVELEKVRSKYGLPQEFFLTLSGFDRGPRKNIGTILEAFRQVRDQVTQKLVVAGRDCEKFRETVDVGDPGLWDDVCFPGWIDQIDLPALYSAAEFFLYPSKMEAFPIPVTEAMTCGAPVITSRVFGLREIAGDAALLVDPDSSTEIADAIKAVLESDDLKRELSQKGQRRAKTFTWDRTAEKTLRILETLGAAQER